MMTSFSENGYVHKFGFMNIPNPNTTQHTVYSQTVDRTTNQDVLLTETCSSS